jgi:hypothetical protein
MRVWFSRGAKALITIAFILAWARSSGTEEVADRGTGAPQSTSSSRRQSRDWVRVAVLILLAVSSGFAGWYNMRPAIAASPGRPDLRRGGILIFLEEPDAPANVNFIIRPDGAFDLDVASDREGAFLAVFSGDAEAIADWTSLNTAESSSHIESLGKAESTYGRFKWYGRFKQGTFDAPGYYEFYDIVGYDADDPTIQVASGRVHHIDSDPGFILGATVSGRLRKPIVSSGGPIEIGQLPLIAASGAANHGYYKSFERIRFSWITLTGGTRSNERWFIPKNAEINVTVPYDSKRTRYGGYVETSVLPAQYRLDSVAPPTPNLNELRWRLKNAANLGWTLRDTSKEKKASNGLFVAGILFAVAATFLGPVVESLLPRRRTPE